MRGLIVPALICLLAVALGAAIVVWARNRRHAPPAGIARVLAAHGAGRCSEAARLLEMLAREGRSAAIVDAWDAIELPLLQALPDCPPDWKLQLANALDASARACRVVETARRLVTMRNALIG